MVSRRARRVGETLSLNVAPILRKLTRCNHDPSSRPKAFALLLNCRLGSAGAFAHAVGRWHGTCGAGVAADAVAARRCLPRARPITHRIARAFTSRGVRRLGLAARHHREISAARGRAVHGQHLLCRARRHLQAGGRAGLCRDAARPPGTAWTFMAGAPPMAKSSVPTISPGEPGAADPELRAGDQSRERPLGDGARQRPRTVHVRPRRRPELRDRAGARVRQCRHRPGAGRLCRAGAAQRRRQPHADGLADTHDRRSDQGEHPHRARRHAAAAQRGRAQRSRTTATPSPAA